jgi:hypothetical protein
MLPDRSLVCRHNFCTTVLKIITLYYFNLLDNQGDLKRRCSDSWLIEGISNMPYVLTLFYFLYLLLVAFPLVAVK